MPDVMPSPTDAALIEAVRNGQTEAFGSLYERHVAAAYNLARQLSRSRTDSDDLVSESFTRMLGILRAGRGPNSAFRAYLLTAVRHVAYDKTRRDRRTELTEDVTTVFGVKTEKIGEQFRDTILDEQETQLARSAFGQLPERWQSILWGTEIEGKSAVELAPRLGLTANGVYALAMRARRGLREAYLSAHLTSPATKHCDIVHAMLAAWTRGTLAPTRAREVQNHLAACKDCQRQADALAEVDAVQLRRAAA